MPRDRRCRSSLGGPDLHRFGGTLTLVDDGAGLDAIDVWQDTAGMVFAAVGPIPFTTLPGDFCGGGTPLSTLSAIHITGGTGLSNVNILMSQVRATDPPVPPFSSLGGPPADWGATNWAIDLSANAGPFVLGPLTLNFPSTLDLVDLSITDGMDVTVGSSGIDLNSDGRLDVTPSGVGVIETVTADSTGSIIDGGGSDATGGPATIPLLLRGGSGDDVPTGGTHRDFIIGEGGDDTIAGGNGGDILVGFGGDDRIAGGPGGDVMVGGRGDDVIEGGGGNDRCSGGPGDDSVHCETVKRGALSHRASLFRRVEAILPLRFSGSPA